MTIDNYPVAIKVQASLYLREDPAHKTEGFFDKVEGLRGKVAYKISNNISPHFLSYFFLYNY